jgi:TP901 family phage tail tape measure protein
MSENFDVHARLSATDEASPVIRGLLSNLKQLDSISKRLSASFNIVGKSGATALEQLNRASKAAASSMNGIANQSRSASRSFSENWRRATNQRLSDSRRMYSALGRMESEYARQIERRIAAERRAERAAGRGIRSSVGGGHIPRPSARSIVYGTAAVGTGVASALRQRMKIQTEEMKMQTFADMTSKEVKEIRKQYADRMAVKYGLGAAATINAVTEAAKAGINKVDLSSFTELAIKTQNALEIPFEDSIKFLGRISTIEGYNQQKFYRYMNSAHLAAKAVVADPKELIESARKSISATVVTKMKLPELFALNAAGTSAGIVPSMMGRFTSSFTARLARADSARGQNAKDLASAANALGFIGRGDMAKQMRNNPTETIIKILTRLKQMPEGMRAKVANQLGKEEWGPKWLTMAAALDTYKRVLKEVASGDPDALNQAAVNKIRSLQGRWNTITAAFGLLTEKIGGGFENLFLELSDSIIKHADSFNFDAIRDHVAGFVDGLKGGFGLKNWGELVDNIASWFAPGSIKKWKEFGQGLAEGIGEFVTGLKYTFKALSFLSAGDSDAKGMGKTIARIGGFIIALSLLTPVVGTLFAFGGALRLLAASPIGRIAVGLGALAIGLHKVLSYVSDRVFSVFVSLVDGVKSVALKIINTVRGWIGLAPVGGGAGGGASGSWTPRSDSPDASGSWSSTASKAKASFIKPSDITPNTSGITGGTLSQAKFESTFAGTPLAGKYDQVVAAAKTNNVPPDLLAAVIAHETGKGRNVRANNVAGIMNSETGYRTKAGYASIDDGIAAAGRVVGSNYRKADGDIDKMGARYAPVGAANDPNGLNKNWAGGVRSFRNGMSDGPAGIMGNPVDVANRYLGMNEYRDTKQIADFIGRDPRGNLAAWCASFTNASLKAAGIAGTGTALASDFMKWGKPISMSDIRKGDVLVQSNGRLPGQAGSHVGMATGNTRMVNGQLQVEMISGNDSDSVKTSWRSADRIMARRAIGNVPTPTEVIANVPNNDAAVTRGILEKNGSALLSGGGNRGNVAIHINGSSHDPEALATLVQRRVDESMNWRMHDVSTAYT